MKARAQLFPDTMREAMLNAYGFEMRRAGAFHLYLNLTIARVYVVELFLARGSRVKLALGVQVFVDMHHATRATDIETQLVECSMRHLLGFSGKEPT